MSLSPPLSFVLVEPRGQQRGGRGQVGQVDQGRNSNVEGVQLRPLRQPGGPLGFPLLPFEGIRLRH
jgi:hypothetical protein